VNVRTQGTINLHADKDINMWAGGKFNVHASNSITLETDTTMTLTSAENMTLYSQARIGVRADGSLAMVSNNGSWNAGGAMALVAGGIDLNDVSTEDVESPVALDKTLMPETEFDSSVGWTVTPSGLESIVSRAPTHEPWPYHNQGVGVDIAMEDGQPTTPPNSPSLPSGWSGEVT
jgi:hypothetical protein